MTRFPRLLFFDFFISLLVCFVSVCLLVLLAFPPSQKDSPSHSIAVLEIPPKIVHEKTGFDRRPAAFEDNEERLTSLTRRHHQTLVVP